MFGEHGGYTRGDDRKVFAKVIEEVIEKMIEKMIETVVVNAVWSWPVSNLTVRLRRPVLSFPILAKKLRG